MFFGLTTTTNVRTLVFELAVANIPPEHYRFDVEKKKARKDWLSGFRLRHPNISLREPKSTSIARAMEFNKQSVNKFFDLMESLLIQYHFTPDKIYNCDESSVTTVQKRNSKVFSQKGKKQVGCISSAERGINVTVVCAVNAAGSYVPPAFIFPRNV